jgi:oxygen-independent coproporphyrinogen-3 oxidase
MLEVDDDSRLGRELMAGGTKYHAHFVPDDDRTADFYETACRRFENVGVSQYEISNFARSGRKSRHNLKYWNRHPYMGFGVDAHSMLLSSTKPGEAVRFASSDSLEEYVAGTSHKTTPVSAQSALEETFFLGLRLNHGVDLESARVEFGDSAIDALSETILECVDLGLLERGGNVIRLTSRGRLLSNDVFERFVAAETVGSPR